MEVDFGLITSALGALQAAIGIGKDAAAASSTLRKSGVIGAVNEKLLDVQQSLFAYNTQIAQLQQQHFEASQELRELKEALAQRQRYTLFEIVPGTFVYRLDVLPRESGTSEPGAAQSECYFCQFCLDGTPSRPVALRFAPANPLKGAFWHCVGCKTSIFDRSSPSTGRGIAAGEPIMGPNSWMGR